MNSIITPTFSGHFPNVGIYLKSFAKYAVKEGDWQIVFTISADEKDAFDELIAPYTKTLPIKVILFEDLLKTFGIDMAPEELLRLYGKFSFQTLKKFYTMLSLDSRHSLVLDSETELVRPTSVNALFDRFFADPFISYSTFDIRQRVSTFTKNVVANRNYIFKTHDKHWFLENFVWFYDKQILTDLFAEHGSPIDIVEKIRLTNNPGRQECGIFEIDLYQSYVYLHRDKYRYRAIDVERFLDDLSEAERSKYLVNWTNKFQGNCGLMEHALMLLTQTNVDVLAKHFCDAGFFIIRCEKSSFRTCKLQARFLDAVRPNVLAASQEHFFGLSPFVLDNNKYAFKSRDARLQWIGQIKFLAGLFINPIRAAFYALKSSAFKRRLVLFRKRRQSALLNRHD